MTSAVTETQLFEELVDGWVQSGLARGAATFDELLVLLPGVYPSAALFSLQRLAETDGTAARLLARMGTAKGEHKLNNTRTRHGIALPRPHPLDFDWRFNDEAVTRLLRECEGVTEPGDSVGLLGAPSLLRAAIENSYSREMILLDACQTTVESLAQHGAKARAIRCDLLEDPLPILHVDAVIADPPWYELHLRGFLWAAAQLCRIGGHILISIPPVGTRPGVERERADLLTWAHEIGMHLLRLEPAVLTYRSPAFEANALKAEGLQFISPEWRRGDLALFSLARRTDNRRPPAPKTYEDDWDEVCLDGVRMRLRRQQCESFCDPALLPVVPGNILPSVSNRDERRSLVDVWTSGNRVFACQGTSILHSIFRALQRGEAPEALISASLGRALSEAEINMVGRARQQINELIKLESSENLSYVEN